LHRLVLQQIVIKLKVEHFTQIRSQLPDE